jgi:P4 family phage/plasmid primase-like protien
MERYETWIQLGWTLHNIDPTSTKLLDIWIEKSSVSTKYKDGECERIWDNSRNDGFTIGTLKYWASIDSPDKYQEFREKRIFHYIEEKNTNTNYFLATVLHRMFHDKYKYSGGEWYMFDNHIWVSQTQKEGFCLREKISTDLYRVYTKVLSRSNQQYSSDQGISEEEKEEHKKKGMEILKIIHNLQTTSFKDNIMKECKELFRDDKFVNRLDCNPYLLAFSNGIYDLKTGQLRKGLPEDMISMSTNMEKIDFDESHEHWPHLQQFLGTVFYEKEMYDYFMTYLATCLQGHNAEEKFRIWTGCGSNGKSKILELFVHCLDSYAIKFPITLLTGKRAASNASTPEIAQSKAKRFGYLEEPDEKEKIIGGLLKEFTGGDKIKARSLFKEPIEFKPQFKLALLCNEIPSFPPYDTGITRRIEIIEFKSKFCANPKEPNEFPIDNQLSEKMKEWKELFMAYLLDVYYERYKAEGIHVPAEVIHFTQEYQKQCDVYTDFFYDIVEDTRNMNDMILLSDLYDEFKVWYEDVFSNTKYPNKSEFRKYLRKKYTDKRISSSSKEIKGFRMRSKVAFKSASEETENMEHYTSQDMESHASSSSLKSFENGY